MKIAIRADGGNEIGMGHIMRTLVLAKELRKNNKVFYICKQSSFSPQKYENGINKLKEEGFEVVLVNEDDCLKELIKIQSDCLVTDSYDVNEDYFNITKNHFKITGYIDDMNLYYFNVDFIINQNIGAELLQYKTNKDTKLFLGTDYIMLREEFRSNDDKIINKNISKIMVTVGGSDINGITNKICNALKEIHFELHIVIGPCFSSKYICELVSLSHNYKNIKLYFNANMIDLMKQCDICISGCGSTLYELAACGIPTIGIILAENQKEIGEKLANLKIIENLGYYTELKSEKLVSAIKDFDLNIEKRKIMSRKLKAMIDGQGVKRIVLQLD
ncbi:UDP-2,4-diacetamido-2,4,6-trideoxy-beta-L-altropyranose hydrolase [Clostridium botulinum]|uniref:UDP-2,4-diacetamido-2,4, 6-trideoxy-beta-L-altropyranose hydrolase n=1 Tax=Clostridium botulinum TaxID=1491 RepID=UPI000773EF17|nr:UDP-2,4-diacetamido-2,4,6-trideoxy-beta-L-altropyranose hydrolase [Clostridium botulinum]MBN1057663.1 UDP-2,4-diacetamido-2,4,6-trideoxy-beta-L-altropyranose hydrolase [Clostridium botulinum]MBN1060908.1 UDP-2,4-diacetamido-2,4,6-trideoxy-beta-L-altropyranose hydrolase [Clostridium botulinum]NFE95094.1 UDP-2,4-diacetamido-2,4,6-trideoxy-beta-L-altropyranose hydrolase [Clostridium botulinum]NFH79856.1 UDP-2,4-diacetamido-2,4,6-trideoxy-beta-L-altropyranose hydrolase [Clostridium botulinum]NF